MDCTKHSTKASMGNKAKYIAVINIENLFHKQRGD